MKKAKPVDHSSISRTPVCSAADLREPNMILKLHFRKASYHHGIIQIKRTDTEYEVICAELWSVDSIYSYINRLTASKR